MKDPKFKQWLDIFAETEWVTPSMLLATFSLPVRDDVERVIEELITDGVVVDVDYNTVYHGPDHDDTSQSADVDWSDVDPEAYKASAEFVEMEAFLELSRDYEESGDVDYFEEYLTESLCEPLEETDIDERNKLSVYPDYNDTPLMEAVMKTVYSNKGARRRKVSCKKGYKAKDGKCVQMTGDEKRKKNRSAKLAARTRRRQGASAMRSRKKKFLQALAKRKAG